MPVALLAGSTQLSATSTRLPSISRLRTTATRIQVEFIVAVQIDVDHDLVDLKVDGSSSFDRALSWTGNGDTARARVFTGRGSEREHWMKREEVRVIGGRNIGIGGTKGTTVGELRRRHQTCRIVATLFARRIADLERDAQIERDVFVT